MPNERLIFLGIDCLDLHLVLRWRMRGFIVGSYGYHFVGHDLYTPIIWAKILTGIDVTKPPYNFSSKTLSRRKRLASLYYLRELAERVLKTTAMVKNETNNNSYLRRIFQKALLGEELQLNELLLIKMLRRTAMMERMPPSLRRRSIPLLAASKGLQVMVIEFPPFNDEVYSLLRNMLYFYIDSTIEEKKFFLNYIWRVTEISVQKILKSIGVKDVIYWYTPYIDTASHIYYRPGNIRYMLALRQAYSKIERLVTKIVKEALDNNYRVIVASDHGFNPRKLDHSHYGYWSVDGEWGPSPKRAEDLFQLAAKALNLF